MSVVIFPVVKIAGQEKLLQEIFPNVAGIILCSAVQPALFIYILAVNLNGGVVGGAKKTTLVLP